MICVNLNCHVTFINCCNLTSSKVFHFLNFRTLKSLIVITFNKCFFLFYLSRLLYICLLKKEKFYTSIVLLYSINIYLLVAFVTKNKNISIIEKIDLKNTITYIYGNHSFSITNKLLVSYLTAFQNKAFKTN